MPRARAASAVQTGAKSFGMAEQRGQLEPGPLNKQVRKTYLLMALEA